MQAEEVEDFTWVGVTTGETQVTVYDVPVQPLVKS